MSKKPNLWIIDGKWQFSFVLCMFFFWTWYECNVYAYCTFRLNMPYWNSLLGFICVVLDVLQWKIAIKNPWVKWKTKGRACSHHWVKKILPLFATYIDFRVLDRERESVGIKRNSDSRQFRRTVPNFILLLLRSFSEISNTRSFQILAEISNRSCTKVIK